MKINKLAIFSAIVIFSGCDNFLSENPDNRVELNSIPKAAQLLTNAYSSAGYTFTEWMSDNVTFTTGTTRLPEHNEAYAWQEVLSVNQDTPTNFWEYTYEAIAHANAVLDVIDGLPGDETQKKAVRAEALLARAYGHFMLVNLFAPYYAEKNVDKPGIPYVLVPEKEFIKQYKRNTVQEVYDLIEKDLLEGIEIVNDSYYANSGKYHFTRNAAFAFASRFFLFKQDYDKCIAYSSALLGNDPGVYVRDIAALLERTANPTEFIATLTSPDETANLLLVRQVTNFPVNVGYWPSPVQVRSLYNRNPFNRDDIRTSNEYPIYLRGSGWALAKFEFLFERSSLTSNVGLYYTIMPVLRGEEVILNRAEAYVMKLDNTRATADLQVFVNKRYDGTPNINLTTMRSHYGVNDNSWALLNFIVDERRKEFMHEGLRWFDIRRFEIPVQHVTENGLPIRLEADDKRKVIQIPKAAIDVGGLEPNPR